MRLTGKQFCKLAVEGRLKIKVPMTPLHIVGGLICYKTSSDKEELVECTIEQYDMFKIEEGYKVTLKAKDWRYGSENYYVSDLVDLIDCGYIQCSIIN